MSKIVKDCQNSLKLVKDRYKLLKIVINDYDETIFVEEALHRLVELHYKMGLVNEAQKYALLLGYNYQSGEWYEKSYEVFNKKYKSKRITKEKKTGLISDKYKYSKVVTRFLHSNHANQPISNTLTTHSPIRSHLLILFRHS